MRSVPRFTPGGRVGGPARRNPVRFRSPGAGGRSGNE